MRPSLSAFGKIIGGGQPPYQNIGGGGAVVPQPPIPTPMVNDEPPCSHVKLPTAECSLSSKVFRKGLTGYIEPPQTHVKLTPKRIVPTLLQFQEVQKP